MAANISYEGKSNNKIELQLGRYDHCLSYVYISYNTI